jgi:hypothetical protein
MDLERALSELRARRKYAATADTDSEQAELAVADAVCDLLEAIAEHIIDNRKEDQ